MDNYKSTRENTLKHKRIAFFNKYYQSKRKIPLGSGELYRETKKLLKFIIPEKCSVLDIGCGKGLYLDELKPKIGVGIDFSEIAILKAKESYRHIEFVVGDVEDEINIEKKFDYILLSYFIGDTIDVLKVFSNIKPCCHKHTKVVITYYNALWDPIIKLADIFGIRKSGFEKNWFSLKDIETVLYLSGFEVISSGSKLLFPIKIPFLSNFINKFISPLPLIRNLNLVTYTVARPIDFSERVEKKVTVVIPTRNEKGNIKDAIERVPSMGLGTELIFVDGDSTDGTVQEIEKFIELYKDKKDIKLIHQVRPRSSEEKKKMLKLGKGDAVRKGFEKASGDILMILDSDLTVLPEDLPKFFDAICSNKAEFINGNRLTYPLDKDAMRFLNKIANRFFGIAFTFLLDQTIKDTLCGTKVLTKEAYAAISKNRNFFGDFDPFGDFDLLFGAAKQNLKIIDVPIRYWARTYGDIKIERFKHGLLLLKMCWFAYKRFKLNK